MKQPDLRIAQGLIVVDSTGARLYAARSSGFSEQFAESAEAVVDKFGFRPRDFQCSETAIQVLRFGEVHIGVVEIAFESSASLFRFLVMAQQLYVHLGDPFAISEKFPVNWTTRGNLADLEWSLELLPRRTLSELQEILKKGEGPLLLGAAQALVDGGRLALVSATPRTGLIRDLWAMLPDRTRSELSLSTFSFAADPHLQIITTPNASSTELPGFLNEEQARDYPEGRYELALQIAIEAGDQRGLDVLLSRRTSDDTLRLAMYLVGGAFLCAGLSKLLLLL